MVQSETPRAAGGIIKFETSGQIPLSAQEEQALRLEQESQRERWVVRNPAAALPNEFRDAVEAASLPILSSLAASVRANAAGRSGEVLVHLGVAAADIFTAGRAGVARYPACMERHAPVLPKLHRDVVRHSTGRI